MKFTKILDLPEYGSLKGAGTVFLKHVVSNSFFTIAIKQTYGIRFQAHATASGRNGMNQIAALPSQASASGQGQSAVSKYVFSRLFSRVDEMQPGQQEARARPSDTEIENFMQYRSRCSI